MSKTQSADLVAKLKASMKASKRDSSKISTGADIKTPSDFIIAPTPIQQLLSLPGYPYNRITQISGKPNSGKTTLAMLAMVEAQKQGDVQIVFGNTEGKFAKDRFVKMGGDPEDMIVCHASSLEELYFFIDQSLTIIFSDNPKAKVFLVVDSIGRTPSEAENNTDADKNLQPATAARVNSSNLRTIVTKWIDKYHICGLFINTNYQNIGSHGRKNNGGDGLEYNSGLIFQLSRIKDLTKDINKVKHIVGIQTKANITKNHIFQGEAAMKAITFNIKAYSVEEAKPSTSTDTEDTEE